MRPTFKIWQDRIPGTETTSLPCPALQTLSEAPRFEAGSPARPL
jgi:hypothetical protein